MAPRFLDLGDSARGSTRNTGNFIPADVAEEEEEEEEPIGDVLLSALGSVARLARTSTLSLVRQAEDLAAPLSQGRGAGISQDCADVEAGEEPQPPRLAAWARQVQQQASAATASAAEQAQQGLDRARSVDWGERVEGVRSAASRGLERVSVSAASASTTLQERVATGVERARSLDLAERTGGLRHAVEERASTVREFSGRHLQALNESQVVQNAKDSASAAATSVRGSLSVAGERVSGAASLAMSPAKLGQFIGVFLVGLCFVLMSLNFLPFLLLAPQKFSMLFTAGSLTMLSSFVLLSGPRAFTAKLAERSRLPFSIAYAIGLVGTLWATLVQRSYLFTAIFAVLQAVVLIYFVCSCVPGGRAGLSMLCRFGGRSARTLLET